MVSFLSFPNWVQRRSQVVAVHHIVCRLGEGRGRENLKQLRENEPTESGKCSLALISNCSLSLSPFSLPHSVRNNSEISQHDKSAAATSRLNFTSRWLSNISTQAHSLSHRHTNSFFLRESKRANLYETFSSFAFLHKKAHGWRKLIIIFKIKKIFPARPHQQCWKSTTQRERGLK